MGQQGGDDPLVAGNHPGPQGPGQPGPLADEGGEQHAVRLAAEQQFGGQAEAGARAEQQVVRGALPDPPAEDALPRGTGPEPQAKQSPADHELDPDRARGLRQRRVGPLLG